ncbi:MAG: (2Fe-2S)-binding protein [Candidatus Thioglobus sp.]|uniref:(2Fe-2S)-binding protein n=1 Tax=Candidatus Thioglobus sp. TaxID=2026721 RepID=UPI0026132481|nr:(2Fe-2S)-binding protein [Candidatus Thioglobus sp.]MDC9727530.1 (2Fe-2S)-binding protein [Candidatus Thioglobus sp.]
MYICICNAVTDKDIQTAINKGASSMNDLSKQLKVGTCCGRCISCAKKMLNQSNSLHVQTLTIPSLQSDVAFA